MWVWKTPSVFAAPGSGERLRDFCKAEGINEVYLSIPATNPEEQIQRWPTVIDLLHRAGIRAEALFGSDDADKPGKPRERLLEQVRGIVQFNQRNPASRFDGIHLDIEPHQRAENKGEGNLHFLPDMLETFRAVRALAEPANMTVNADIANKMLKADAPARKALLTSVPRLTLMLYELTSPNDGKTNAAKIEKLRRAGEKYLALTYAGVTGTNLAKLGIALRTPDYGPALPQMLKTLDDAHGRDPHYLGWARHSYNDVLPSGY